jgi:hypothetical protein
MRKLYWYPLLLSLAACGGVPADEPPADEPTFTLRVHPGTNVIDQIARTAPASVKDQCEASGGVVRIVNPFREGEYEDLPCSALGEAEPVADGEPGAEPQWSPAGLACWAMMTGVGLIGTAICERGSREHPPAAHPDRWPPEDRPQARERQCKGFLGSSGIGLGLLCAVLF